MRTWILLSVLLANCFACQAEDTNSDVRVSKDGNGIFITTNSSYPRFYLVSDKLKFPPLVGTRLDTNLVHKSTIFETVQYVPDDRISNGMLISKGYIQRSGRCAQLSGRTVKLIKFKIRCSHDEQPRGRDIGSRIKRNGIWSIKHFCG